MINDYVQKIPLLSELEKTEQEPEWHGEGNVRIHTEMVLEELSELLSTEAKHLSSSDEKVLRHAALFHDIGKALTTKKMVRNGVERIVSPRHAKRGRDYLSFLIKKTDLSREEALKTQALVAYHHNPKYLVTDDKPERKWAELSRLVPTELVYWLERADLQGRICDDLDEQLEYLELFRMEMETLGFWNTNFHDPYEEWDQAIRDALEGPESYFTFVLQNAILNYEAGRIQSPYEAIPRARSEFPPEEYKELIVTCAISGSGKSTWVREQNHDVVSMDEIRRQVTGNIHDQSQNGKVFQAAKEQLKEALRNDRSVIWEATNTRKDFRRVPIGIGYQYGAHVKIRFWWLNEETIRERNKNREASVREGVIDSQISSFEWPSKNEAHELIITE